MKILVYKDNLSTGRGADRAVRNFAVALSGRGNEVLLVEKAELISALSVAKPDVIVATGSNEAVDLMECGYLARTDRAPVVLQLHLAPTGFFKWRHPFRNLQIARAFRLVDAVQVLCGDYVREFHAISRATPVSVIGNFTDRPKPDQVPDVRPPVILYPAAAFTSVKNQMLLLRAFGSIAAEFPEWRLRLLGKATTPYGARCRKWIVHSGLSDRIDVVGFTDDLDAEYKNASFIAFPSIMEGFPLAVLESARYELPVVANTELPGVGDIVRPDETGLIAGSSPKAFADGLRCLMADASMRRRMGERARTYCEENFNREHILDQWDALLSEVVKKQKFH